MVSFVVDIIVRKRGWNQ